MTPSPQSGGLEYFKNTEEIHFHKSGPVCLPFLLTFVHFRGGVRFERGLS